MLPRRHPSGPALHAALWATAGIVACVVVPQVLPIDLELLARPEVLALLAVPILASLNHFDMVPSTREDHLQEQHALDEAGVVLLLLVLPPGPAWLLSLVGYGIGAALRGASPVKLAFNIGQWAFSLGMAAVLFEVLAPAAAPSLTAGTVLAVTVAMVAHGVINYVAVGAVVCAASGVSWADRVGATVRVWAHSLVGNLLLGLTAAALWLHSPWLVVVAIGLVVVLRRAYGAMIAANEREDRVRIDRDRLDLIITEATTGVALLDHLGTITVWNAAMEDMTGIPEAEAMHRNVDDVLAGQVRRPGDDEQPASTLGRADRKQSEEVVLRHRSGEDRIVSVSHRVQRDRVGHVVGDVVQMQDLTAERETARLKDDFLARITHELRTPLTSIVGFGRTLQHRGDELPPATRDQLRRSLVHAGEQMERLVDDLLLVATGDSTESGRSPRRLEALPLAPRVEQAVELELESHGGRFVDVRHLSDAHAVIEPSWLTTVLRHLVSNALTYSDDLSPVVVEVDTTDEHALVRVIDEGRGIPPSKIYRVFDRFARVEDPLRMETRGAGLGLFIVDRLTARMGGHVQVDSTLGEGSTFEVRLPLSPSESTPLVQPVTADTAG